MDERGYIGFVEEVAKNPVDQIARYVASGREVIGYMCTYVPEELIYAAGLLPFRLLGRATQLSRADRYLQSYCCSHIRGFMEDFLGGDYRELSGVLFAHTCDTMQSFCDIFRHNNPEIYTHNLNFPARIDGETPFRFALHEYVRFRESLERHIGRAIDAEALRDAVEVYNRTRSLLSELYALHAAAQNSLPSVVLLNSVLASMFMDKREFNERLAGFLEELKSSSEADSSVRKRVLLVGSVNIRGDVYDLIDDNGAKVVDDDLCTGRRYFDGQVEEPTDESILRRYFDRAHCPAKYRTTYSRAEYLCQLARDRKVDGVLFLHIKFCDPHAFDYPYLKEALEREGVRTHMIEMEHFLAAGGQLGTKVQAFVELL